MLIQQMNRNGMTAEELKNERKILEKDIEDYKFTVLTDLENMDLDYINYASIDIMKGFRNKLLELKNEIKYFDIAIQYNIKKAQNKHIK